MRERAKGNGCRVSRFFPSVRYRISLALSMLPKDFVRDYYADQAREILAAAPSSPLPEASDEQAGGAAELRWFDLAQVCLR